MVGSSSLLLLHGPNPVLLMATHTCALGPDGVPSVHISLVPSPPTSSISSLRIFVRSSQDQSSAVADQTEFLPCTYPQCLLLPLLLYPHCVFVCPGEKDLGFSSSRSSSRRRKRLPRTNLTNRNSSDVQLEHAHAILKVVSKCLHFKGGKRLPIGDL